MLTIRVLYGVVEDLGEGGGEGRTYVGCWSRPVELGLAFKLQLLERIRRDLELPRKLGA